MIKSAVRRSAFVAATLAGLAAVCVPVADAVGHHSSAPEPTVVFVHGGFADSSGSYGAMDRLCMDCYPVGAANNPMRGHPGDSAHLDSPSSDKAPINPAGHAYGAGSRHHRGRG